MCSKALKKLYGARKVLPSIKRLHFTLLHFFSSHSFFVAFLTETFLCWVKYINFCHVLKRDLEFFFLSYIWNVYVCFIFRKIFQDWIYEKYITEQILKLAILWKYLCVYIKEIFFLWTFFLNLPPFLSTNLPEKQIKYCFSRTGLFPVVLLTFWW